MGEDFNNKSHRPKNPAIGFQLEVVRLTNCFLLSLWFSSSPLFGESELDNCDPHNSPPFYNVICLFTQAVIT
uniref:Uncharacterized protein n=1 Tax=Myoviridae sp. ctijX18 TaxID=2825154 RepID=A0A8S5USQ2_9CAUD|nr:MAG TPA: hypothetical protein [Myoviridae sp. ctijX18]DAQ61262.1 MAG TPA: hypothetical protein [Caudoviricetes sp.]